MMENLIKKKNDRTTGDFDEIHEVKYSKPKILLVDIKNDIADKLEEEGFNIDKGTFGSIDAAQPNQICELNGKLPFLNETDIVFVSLESENKLKNSIYRDEETVAADDFVFVTPRRQNYFDGRSAYSVGQRENLKRVIKNGGIIVVFADSPVIETYYITEFRKGLRYEPTSKKISNYDWAPSKLYTQDCIEGNEVFISDTLKEVAQAIIKGSEEEISYRCEFNSIFESENTSILYKNRSGKVIGFLEKLNEGYLIVLPRFENLHKPISNLIKEVLPELIPDLFPDFVKNSWVNNEKYVFPDEKKLIAQREEIVKKYSEKIKELEENISKVREEHQFLTNTITSQGFGEFLVENLKKVFEYIGYNKVIDSDLVVDGNRQEDLRILDDDRLTLIEIKGHKGRPTEDDCQAIVKYILRNIKSEKRTDVHGILIVNHQRMLAPLDRGFPGYTPEQIEDADSHTLVTTWELYKAVRLYQEGLITFEDINKSLHTPGLFKAIPSTFSYLGQIVQFYNRNKENNIVCFNLECSRIEQGDLLIIKDGNEYFSQIVDEMMVENVVVKSAKRREKLSIKISKAISKQAEIYVNRLD